MRSIVPKAIPALVVTAFIVLAPPHANAQRQVASDRAIATDTVHRAPLFTRTDGWILAGFVAGTAAIAPFDRRIATDIQKPGPQGNLTASRIMKTFNFLGSPGTLIAGVALYGVGRIGHFDRVADLGLHGTEAVVASAGVTYLIKGLAGRQRPYYAGVDDPDDFKFADGFGSGSHSSFPSGHATAAFAAATVVTLEARRWSKGSTWYVAPIMFAGASLVGGARLYLNKHWASDVVMGAGIGTLTGVTVFRYNHEHPDNRVNRWLLGATPAVSPSLDGRGVNVGFSLVAPR